VIIVSDLADIHFDNPDVTYTTEPLPKVQTMYRIQQRFPQPVRMCVSSPTRRRRRNGEVVTGAIGVDSSSSTNPYRARRGVKSASTPWRQTEMQHAQYSRQLLTPLYYIPQVTE